MLLVAFGSLVEVYLLESGVFGIIGTIRPWEGWIGGMAKPDAAGVDGKKGGWECYNGVFTSVAFWLGLLRCRLWDLCRG